MKETANNLYKQSKFSEAIEVYSNAIVLNPTAIYYANRSSANLKLGRFDCAVNDASQAIKIDETYLKGYIRRADAYLALEQYTLAIKDYERAKRSAHKNTWLIAQIAKCNELIQQDGSTYQNIYLKFIHLM